MIKTAAKTLYFSPKTFTFFEVSTWLQCCFYSIWLKSWFLMATACVKGHLSISSVVTGVNSQQHPFKTGGSECGKQKNKHILLTDKHQKSVDEWGSCFVIQDEPLNLHHLTLESDLFKSSIFLCLLTAGTINSKLFLCVTDESLQLVNYWEIICTVEDGEHTGLHLSFWGNV